jgi:hypothetical protein
MSITQSRRYEMHEVLRGKLGVGVADTLVEHLPPEGWGDVATKKDLSQVRTELQMEIALLRSELHQEIALLRSEMIQMEERLTMKIDLAIAKAISNQNKWMIGFMFSLVVPLSIALLR